jgi:hypothetical protein
MGNWSEQSDPFSVRAFLAGEIEENAPQICKMLRKSVGGGERMGHFRGPECASAPEEDGDEECRQPGKVDTVFPAVSS